MDKFFDSGNGGEVVDDSSPRFIPWKPDKPLGYESLHASFLRLIFLQNFAAEILTSDPEELKHDHVKQILVKAGGANYGTGQ